MITFIEQMVLYPKCEIDEKEAAMASVTKFGKMLLGIFLLLKWQNIEKTIKPSGHTAFNQCDRL